MKKNILSLAVLIVFTTTFLFSCSKSSNSTPVTATSQWTFDSKTFTVTGASLGSSNQLYAHDDLGAVGGGNFIKITFGSIARPTSSFTFTVVDVPATSNPTNCTIQVGNLYDATRPTAYLSTGKAGDKVVLTISPSGKLTASFTNISVTDYLSPTPKTVSGTIVEE